MSRYDDEPFLLWFTRPTPTWLDLSAAARGVAISVAMEIGLGKSGGITLRKGLRSLETLVRIPWETLEPAIAELVAAGKLTWDGSKFFLFDPEYAERKRKSSADRMRDKRSRDRTPSEPPPESPKSDASDVTSVTAVTAPTCDAGDALSNLISSDLISDLKIPEEIPSARARPDRLAKPPWWSDVLETMATDSERILDPGNAWLRYAGHRASKETQTGRPYPANREDAIYWLSTVIVPMQKKDRQDAFEKRERDAKFDAERAANKGSRASPFTEPQKLTAEQQRELAEKFPMRRRAKEVA